MSNSSWVRRLAWVASILVALAAWPALQFYQEIAKSISEDPGAWEQDIEALLDSTSGPAGSVLFVGSSSIRLWGTLHRDMAPMPVIQRGFGGAKINDVVHYAPQLFDVKDPAAIVLFAGTNDVSPGSAKEPQQVFASYRQLVTSIRVLHPDVPVFYIAITPTPLRWEVWPVADEINTLIAEYSARYPLLHVIDTGTALMNGDEPNPDNYVFDGLHLSEQGYSIWTHTIRNRLQQDVPRLRGDTADLDSLAFVQDPEVDSVHPPQAQEITLMSQGSRLPALLYTANGAGPHPTVLLLHGLPGNEKNLDIAQILRRAGYNVLFFHYRGAWGAEGEYYLTQLADDTAAALAFLREEDNARKYRVDVSKLSLLGHSLGGYTALAAGSRDHELVCVGAMSPANLAVMAKGIQLEDPAALAFLTYADSLFMLRGFDAQRMREELLTTDMEELDTSRFGPGLTDKSVLMVVGEQDDVTPRTSMFDPVVTAYQKTPGLVLQAHVIPGDHSYSTSRVQLTRTVLEWLQEYCR